MNLGFLAHDIKKVLLKNFCAEYFDLLKSHEIYATGSTGNIISEIPGLETHTLLAGALGGEHQLAAMVEAGEIDAVFLFRDPAVIQSNTNGYTKLYDACDFQNIPLATNLATAEILIKAINQSV